MSTGDHSAQRDPGQKLGIYGPFVASIRNHLGELADEVMKGKIAVARKLNAQIETENDIEKLKELRKELHDALFSEDDVDQLDAKLDKMLEMLKKHAQTLMEIKTIVYGPREQHRS